MEIIQILPEIYRFKDCGCSDCTFRFGCWTCESCPLKAVRVVEEEIGDNHLFMKCREGRISINENLGKFDRRLLTKIGEDLLEAWHESKQKS